MRFPKDVSLPMAVPERRMLTGPAALAISRHFAMKPLWVVSGLTAPGRSVTRPSDKGAREEIRQEAC